MLFKLVDVGSGWRWARAFCATCLCAAATANAALAMPSAAAVGNVPVAIDMPTIGTHAEIMSLGLDDDGAMQAPSDPDMVGWFAPGVGLGTPGNVLLDGHVDWGGRLRAFALLKRLQPGDTFQLTDDAGNRLSYIVLWIRLYEADTARA